MDYKLPLQNFSGHVARKPNEIFLNQPIDRELVTFTFREVDDQARRIAAGLQAQGFDPGDRIAILSKNCAEWFIADLAIMMAGMVSVPIYHTAGESTIEYALGHSEARAVFLGKLDGTDAAESAIPDSVMRIAMPYPTASAGERWNSWLKRFDPLEQEARPKPDDPLTISYTSGSTGTPKGVVLTHKNFAANAYHSLKVAKAQPSWALISYLPLAHVTERGLIEMLSYAGGNPVFFVESLDTFLDDLNTAKPALFISVPRLWTKFQSGVLKKMPNQKLQRLLRIPLLGRFVAWKIRRGLGLNRTRIYGSGTAPISPAVLEWYQRLRMPIAEGWGMTETTGLACLNLPFKADRLGTIGVPLPCVEMKLSEDSEILIRGEAVFKEYYKNPEVTAEEFTDGWFHTGDVATQLPNGAYKIIGRAKEQFKTAKGKYVAPVPIESLLGSDPIIEQVCVMGSGRKQPIAMVVLGDGVDAEQARHQLQVLMKEVNSQLESHQRLDHIIVCKDDWGVENDFLTPTLKLKRNILESHYMPIIESKQLGATVVWEADL